MLVGDPRQLPEIDCGGLLRGLGERLDPIRLTANRRQREPWERAALAKLREGEVDTALAEYQAHNRIVAAPTASMTRQTLVADWWASRLAGQRTLIVASRWYEVDDLNARARQLVATQGSLSGPILDIDGRPYQAGDEIITLHNQRRLGVRNGTIATITRIDPDERAITVRSAHGTHTLPAAYLDAGYVRHGYATTIHKAQGLTVDQAFVLGDDTLYQEAGYVALSRGRAQNRLYVVARLDDGEHHAQASERPALDQVAGALRVSRAQQLAIDHGVKALEPPEQHLAEFYDERDRLRAVLRTAPADQAANIGALQRSLDRLRHSLGHERAQLAALTERHPIRNRREIRSRRVATARNVDLLETRLDDTDRALASAVEQQGARADFFAEHRESVDGLRGVERAIERGLDHLVDSYRRDPPAYLAALGPFPADPEARSRWTAAARAIEDYRFDRHVTDDQHPLGPTDRGDPQQQLVSLQLDGILEVPHHGRDCDRPGVDLDRG